MRPEGDEEMSDGGDHQGSGRGGTISNITAILVVIAGLIGALDALYQQSHAFSCRLWQGFWWCDQESQHTSRPDPCEGLNPEECLTFRKLIQEFRQ